MMRTVGPWGALLMDISTVGMYFGGLCAYCVIGADYLHSSYNWIMGIQPCAEPADPSMCSDYNECVTHESKVNTYCILIIGLGLFIIESFISNISVMNTISSFALLIVFITVVCVAIRVIQTLSTGKLPYADDWVPPEPRVPMVPAVDAALIDLPSFFGLFSLQALIPPYYGELKLENSEAKKLVTQTSDITVVISAILYYATGVMGPLIFNGPNQPAHY